MKSKVLIACALLVLAPHQARARTVDRVAAVVGGQIIMLSEVRQFSTPFLKMVHEADTIARARAESKVLHDVCERLIDEMLVTQEAERTNVTVTPDEVQRAVLAVAEENHLTIPALFDAAREQGYEEAQYRASLRAQILEMKIIRARSAGTASTKTPEEQTKALHTELRGRTYIEVRLAP